MDIQSIQTLFHAAHWQGYQSLYCEKEKFFLEVSDRNLEIPFGLS